MATDASAGYGTDAVGDETTSCLIRSVRLLDPVVGFDGIVDFGWRDGRIAHLGEQAPDATYDEIIDGGGLWLMPGAIDLCARPREPGAVHKATMKSEAAAALAGGVTSLCIPPDTVPVIDNAAVVLRIQRIAAAAGGARIHLLGALTQGLAGDTLAEMSALRKAGCVGVSNALAPLANLMLARRALDYAAGLGLTVHIVPLEAALANGGCAHEGLVAMRLGLTPIPVAAETVALRQWISLVEDTGARAHFGRLSSARGVQLVADAKARGLPVTADVAVHQLLLTEDDIGAFDARCHVLPPLRAAADRACLREALNDGVIDAVCSDHQPHEQDAKTNPFPLTEPGISGLDTLLPLCLRLVEEGVLSPLQVAARLSAAPAAIIGRPMERLKPGRVADLVLLDPQQHWIADAASMLSRGHNTPFLGQPMRGRALRSFQGGDGGL